MIRGLWIALLCAVLPLSAIGCSEPESYAGLIASEVGLATVSRPLQPKPMPDEPQPGEPAVPADVIPDVPTKVTPACDCVDCDCDPCLCGETRWSVIAKAKGWAPGQRVLVCIDKDPPPHDAGVAVWKGKASATWAAGIYEYTWDGTTLRALVTPPAADYGRRRLFRRRAETLQGLQRAACIS